MTRRISPGQRGRTVGYYILPHQEKLIAAIAARANPPMTNSQAVGLCIDREARRQKVSLPHDQTSPAGDQAESAAAAAGP